VDIVLPSMPMIHLLILAVHLLGTIAELLRPSRARAVVVESLLLKHQLVEPSGRISPTQRRMPGTVLGFWLTGVSPFGLFEAR
jgi:hypothetical protein